MKMGMVQMWWFLGCRVGSLAGAFWR